MSEFNRYRLTEIVLFVISIVLAVKFYGVALGIIVFLLAVSEDCHCRAFYKRKLNKRNNCKWYK